jgi:serine/threonine-protein kinase
MALVGGVSQALTAGTSGDVTGAAQLAVSPHGDLAYIASPLVPIDERRLVTVDRTGRVAPLPAPVRSYTPSIDLSPDGQQLAAAVRTTSEQSLWVFDLARQTLTRLTPPAGEISFPRWAPDGRRLAFNWQDRGAGVLGWQRADGSAPPERLSTATGFPSSWSRDGRLLWFVTGHSDDTWGICALDTGGAPPRVIPMAQAAGSELWRREVYLKPYPGPGPRLQVSVDGGANPVWNPNGTEILFDGPTESPRRRRMLSVTIALGERPILGKPRELFEYDRDDVDFYCQPVRCYALAQDGQKFYATQHVKTDPPPPVTHINLVLNWRAELEAKVPSGR